MGENHSHKAEKADADLSSVANAFNAIQARLAKFDTMSDELAALKIENATLKAQVSARGELSEDTKIELAKLRAELGSRQAVIDTLRNDLTKAHKDLRERKRDTVNMEKAGDAVSTIAASLIEENAKLKAKVSELERSVRDQTTQHYNWRGQEEEIIKLRTMLKKALRLVRDYEEGLRNMVVTSVDPESFESGELEEIYEHNFTTPALLLDVVRAYIIALHVVTVPSAPYVPKYHTSSTFTRPVYGCPAEDDSGEQK